MGWQSGLLKHSKRFPQAMILKISHSEENGRTFVPGGGWRSAQEEIR